MFLRHAWPLLLFFCLGATECQLDEDLGEETDLAFDTLEYVDGNDVEGDQSGIASKQLLVIRDADTFTDFWADHTALMAPQPAEPDVDFETDMVVAAFLGERATGGFSVQIEDVRENNDFIIVDVEIETPGDDCVLTQSVTQPHHVIVLEDSDKPVQFSETTVEADACTGGT